MICRNVCLENGNISGLVCIRNCQSFWDIRLLFIFKKRLLFIKHLEIESKGPVLLVQ